MSVYSQLTNNDLVFKLKTLHGEEKQMEKLKEAKALLSHALPQATFAELIDGPNHCHRGITSASN